MALALFSEFIALREGDERVFHHQELNPPDRGKAELLELRWTHDHVDGDLAFGSLHVSGMGTLDLDAYVYRPYVTNISNESAWLSGIDLPRDVGGPDRHQLTGGPLHTERLLPSEMSARSYRRERLGKAGGPPIIPFSPNEYQEIRGWQGGIREKGFDCNFGQGPYLEYKRTVCPSLSAKVQRGGLEGSLELRRLRSSFFRSTYSVWSSDRSFRRPQVNQLVKRARPFGTSIPVEKCGSFEEMLEVMDKAVDDLVLRNERHLRCKINGVK